MMDLIFVLVGSFVGTVFVVPFVKRWWINQRFPYRWKCPRCEFYIRTNNRETFEISKSSHNHARLKEYK